MNNKSSIGCLDKLYASVQSIESQYLVNEGCRAMLLRPRNSSMREANILAVNIDDTEPIKYYICSRWTCSHKLLSTYRNTRCKCGDVMNKEVNLVPTAASMENADGVFVKLKRFVIGEDLTLVPIREIVTLLDRFGIKDVNVLKEKTVQIGRKEVLLLLRRSLLSKAPLTEVFLLDQSQVILPELKPKIGVNEQPLQGEEASSGAKKITIKLVFTHEKVLYAETNHDFVDLIFSFLTFPLGSVEKIFGAQSSLGCFDNLYTCAKDLSSIHGLNKHECEGKVLNPKLPPDYGCKNQLINIQEEPKTQYYMCSKYDPTCFHSTCPYLSSTYHDKCPCGCYMGICLNIIEPGGGFICKSSCTYMVTDELEVKPLSLLSSIYLRNSEKDPLLESQISVGEKEALAVLKASLTSKTVLTDTFLPKTSGWKHAN